MVAIPNASVIVAFVAAVKLILKVSLPSITKSLVIGTLTVAVNCPGANVTVPVVVV